MWVSAQYINSFINNDYCKIVALCTRDHEKGKNAIKKYTLDNCTVFTDFTAMLKISEIDIVCVLTPNFLHLNQAIQCAEAGKNFILEKPIALNWSEVKLLNSALQKNSVKNIVGFVLWWNSLFKNIRAVIDLC